MAQSTPDRTLPRQAPAGAPAPRSRSVARLSARIAEGRASLAGRHVTRARREPAAGAEGAVAEVTRLDPTRGRGRVIVLGNEKGGTGKSTLAMHLIVALLREGRRVAALDLDERQLTLSQYLRNRRATAEARGEALPMPDLHPAEGARTGHQLAALRGQYDFVVVDMPGGDTAAASAALAEADLLLTPVNDSFVDLDVLGRLDPETRAFREPGHFARCVERKLGGAGRAARWMVVRNRMTPLASRNQGAVADALPTLAAALGFELGAGIVERVIYRELFEAGLTLSDLAAGGAGAGTLTMSHVAARQELRSLLAQVVEAAERRPDPATGPKRTAVLAA